MSPGENTTIDIPLSKFKLCLTRPYAQAFIALCLGVEVDTPQAL